MWTCIAGAEADDASSSHAITGGCVVEELRNVEAIVAFRQREGGLERAGEYPGVSCRPLETQTASREGTSVRRLMTPQAAAVQRSRHGANLD